MTHGLWLSAAGLQAQQARQDVLANNLANVETAGFKPDRVMFRERLVAAQSDGVPGDAERLGHALLDRMTGGLAITPIRTDFSQGNLVTTQNELDLAIDGKGFFAVRSGDGVRYTRNGRLSLRADGTLVTSSGGLEVLDQAAQPIRLDPASAGRISVNPRGQVRQAGALVADLQIVDFANTEILQKTGRNLFDAGGARAVAAVADVRQFAYEGSGAESMTTLVQMIEATRAYQLNATMITLQDQTLGRAVNDVGRLA